MELGTYMSTEKSLFLTRRFFLVAETLKNINKIVTKKCEYVVLKEVFLKVHFKCHVQT